MFETSGSNATSLKNGAAFQLSDGNGKVLAMVRSGKSYALKMVAANSKTILAETLWKVEYTKESDKKYYFTFVSAPYGIPLSFSTENASKDKWGAATEFPGKVSVWEWQEGVEGDGIDAAALKYRFANPDSVMSLAVKDGAVGAIKYAQSKESAATTLELRPVVAASTVLTADDLNSMFLSEKGDGYLHLGFTKDVLNGEANKWLDKYTAVAAVGKLQSNVADAINAAVEAAENIATPAGLAAWIRNKAETEAKTTAAEAVYEAMAKAAESANSIEKAKAAVSKLNDAYKEAADVAEAKVDYATEIASALEKDDAKMALYSAYKGAVEAESYGSGSNAEASEAVREYFLGLTSEADYDLPALQNADGFKNAVDHFTAVDFDAQDAKAVSDAIKALLNDEADDESECLALVEGLATNEGITALEPAEGEGGNTTEEFAVIRDAVIADYTEKVKAYWALPGASDVSATLTAIKGVYTDAATASVQNITDATNIVAAVEALKGINTKAEYKEIVDAVDLDDLDEEDNAAEIKEIREAFYALVPGDRLEGDVDAAATAKIVADYRAAETPIEADKTTADEANTAIADYGTNPSYVNLVTPAIRATIADSYQADQKTAVNELLDAIDGDTNYKTILDHLETASEELLEGITFSMDQYISLNVPGSNPSTYLYVDTAFLTKDAGKKHLAFAVGKYNDALTTTAGKAVAANVQKDFNARFDFKFTYYPTQDSLVITTPMGVAHPSQEKDYVDMTNAEIQASWDKHEAEDIVKLAILAENHREVTMGEDEDVEGITNPNPATTINTRIFLGYPLKDKASLADGVYTIKYISNQPWNKEGNGRNIVRNWLGTDQAMAKVDNQDLLHIPAAQWVVSQEKGADLHTILNREDAQSLVRYADFGQVQQQYLYKTDTENLFTTVDGDSLQFTNVTASVNGNEYLGYFKAADFNEETGDQLEVYALNYLNDIKDLYVSAKADSLLNVTKVENSDDRLYFRLIPASEEVAYGVESAIATQLKRQSYYIQLESDNKNIKEEDKLYIHLEADGTYKLQTREEGRYAYLLKEFKEADACYYALINSDEKATMYYGKISVKDYPSDLVVETLEWEAEPSAWGYNADGRTSTFGLVAKDAPKYRRLGVTVEDGLNKEGTNYAKFYQTRNTNRYLYENTINKVAGYEADPLGLNFLGDFNKKELEGKASIFVDTAYVRNNTNRPQYMLAMRPDFTPYEEDCPYDPSHGKHQRQQVRASYLVTLTDSVINAVNKTEQAKFMYENRTYTRLAFVDAIHRGDSLIITDSKFNGTKLAGNDTIDLSKNAFVEGAWQFRLTKNDDETAEFYIEGAEPNSFIRLINGVAVLTYNISDAERFNIEITDEEATANESVNASAFSVATIDGAVVVKGAEGKNVVITNVLGQTIASTVIASSEATISVPAGVVVVAVEGEAAVKAIVK